MDDVRRISKIVVVVACRSSTPVEVDFLARSLGGAALIDRVQIRTEQELL
jgi:hypothetical protein